MLFLLFHVRDNVRRTPPSPPSPPSLPFLYPSHGIHASKIRFKKGELLEVGRTFSEFCGKTVDDDDDTFIKVSKL